MFLRIQCCLPLNNSMILDKDWISLRFRACLCKMEIRGSDFVRPNINIEYKEYTVYIRNFLKGIIHSLIYFHLLLLF